MMSSSAPESQARPTPQSATQYQQLSLPPIRQLHPYLPPSGAPQPHLSVQESYSYPPPVAYAGPSGSTDSHPSQTIPSQSGMYPRSDPIDSDMEGDVEQQGPAKKKRRRQALSCNGTSFYYMYC
ncbi:hypothetical protein PAXRUDRAFT_565984 [Paxillus rubicundulus Ve08.2h10]|uniref:Uncharacterized protein n=1 Tax=Paxillus rubicundulus Ve08.2h10 TaxID=930991 RepID=A0A0D0D6V7_9AGAM|nr:hypothetical protein PAXRUDRAFT_565984 [Paxillus rubicundulus Ve08.2h10]